MAEGSTERKSPYGAFATFDNFLAQLAKRPEMLPRRIDKSLMRGMSGGTQSQLLGALRFFGLVEGEDDSTHHALTELVRRDDDGRKAWMADALRAFYTDAMALSERAGTAGELAELFTSQYGHKGSTRDKAMRFFLQMAQHAGIEVSPHFAIPRATASAGSGTRRRRTKQTTSHQADPDARSAPDTHQVKLRGGGTVSITVRESHFNLSIHRTDRDFVNSLVDAMIDYANEREVEVSREGDSEIEPS